MTPCESCIRDLRAHMPAYRKAGGEHYSELSGKLEQAKERSRRALDDAKGTGERNPSTEVHELVEFLQHLRVGA